MLPDPTFSPTQLQPVTPFTPGHGADGEFDAHAVALLGQLEPTGRAERPAFTSGPDTDRGRRSDSTAETNLRRQTRPDPTAARPAAGSRFGEFLLLEEIGRGAFSRVFLAQQTDLADRTVVVKITTNAERESNTLSRLRHPNIVPLHSAHRTGDRHVVCMPYLGSVTLADVYRTLESMPSLPDSGRDLFSTLTTRRAATLPQGRPTDVPIIPRPAEVVPALASLAGRSYVEAVLWLATRLADALAYAHDQGVVHRDLKPANVLLADDGQPMLLDFNLATPETTGGDEVRGGTPQYMSPEQLDTFAGRFRPVDRRSDVYALGVMLFELLTRRSPFPRHRPAGGEVLRAMLAERAGSPPLLRPWNRAVSPAVEAIVRRCLEPDPAARYQSAHELKADLDRHLADRPLWHATEPCRRERLRKYWRRNRSVVLAIGLVSVVAVAGALVTTGYAERGSRLGRFEAAATARAFAADGQAATVLLLDTADRARLDEGVQAGEAALARYTVMGRPDWWADQAVTVLDPADQERLRGRVGELLVLLGRATAKRAILDAGRADPMPPLRQAFEMNTAALACYAGQPEPRGVWEHRAELARLLGRPDEARQLAKRASEPPADATAGRLLQAHRHMSQGEYRNALPLLRDLSRDDPQDFAVWYMLGVCNLELTHDATAASCFGSCVALQPDCPWGWYQHGRAMWRLREFDQARADFARVVALRPDFAVEDMSTAPSR